MKITLEIDRAKPLIALALMCLMFSFGVTAAFTQTPEKILTAAETEAVLEEAARGALEAIGDEALFDAIVEKWEAREDLEGKTKSQILRQLFADVQAVITDPAMRTKIWRAWHPPSVATVPKPAATLTQQPIKPAATQNNPPAGAPRWIPGTYRLKMEGMQDDLTMRVTDQGGKLTASGKNNYVNVIGFEVSDGGSVTVTVNYTGPVVSLKGKIIGRRMIGQYTIHNEVKSWSASAAGYVDPTTPGAISFIASSLDGKKLFTASFEGALFTSTNSGLNWTRRENPRKWIAGASSADGTMLVAAVSGGQLYTSGDSGTTWVARENNRYWISIASSADGANLAALVEGGQIYVSSDAGESWVPRGAALNWRSIASSADGSLLLAAENAGRLYLSRDAGETWSLTDKLSNTTALIGDRNWSSVSSSADGSVLASAEQDGQVYASFNSGATWNRLETGRGEWSAVAVSSDGSTLLTVGRNFYVSRDRGETWNEVGRGGSFFGPYSIAASANAATVIIADGGYDGTSVKQGDKGLYVSADLGVNWSVRSPTGSRNGPINKQQIILPDTDSAGLPDHYPMRSWTAVASSADGTKLVAAAGPDAGIMFEVQGFSSDTSIPFDQWYKTRVTGTANLYTSTDSGMTWKARAASRRWIAVASSSDGSRLLAADVGGRLYTSADSGKTWTPRESDRLWFSVASSADGMKLAAVVMGGQIYTSNDAGATWTPRDIARYWKTIASSGDGRVLVAAASAFDGMLLRWGHTGSIYVSTDFGATWKPRGEAGNWFSVAASADGRTLFAVQYGAATIDNSYKGIIVRSTDAGETWTELPGPREGSETENPAGYLPWFSIATSADGTKLALVDQHYSVIQELRDRGDSGLGVLWTSSDSGKTWSGQAAMGTKKRWSAVAVSGNGNVIVGLIYRGDNWVSRNSGKNWLKGGNGGIEWRAVTSSLDGSRVVAVPVTGEGFASSDFGENWSPIGESRKWNSIAASTDGTRLAAAVSVKDPANPFVETGAIITSANSGEAWVPRGRQRSWKAIASSSNGSKLVAAFATKRSYSMLYVSSDYGATWIAREEDRRWSAVASSSDGTRLAAVTYKDRIYISADSGATWTPRETNREWTAVASSSNGAKLVAAAWQGQIYTSADFGATWTARSTNQQWSAVASSVDGSKLIAADLGGFLYTSSDSGATWTKRAWIDEWAAVASSGDGTRLVAASKIGGLWISTDSGATWEEKGSE